MSDDPPADVKVVFTRPTPTTFTWPQALLLSEAMAFFVRVKPATSIEGSIARTVLHGLLGQLRAQDPAETPEPTLKAWDGESATMMAAVRRYQAFEADSVKDCEQLLNLLEEAFARSKANQRADVNSAATRAQQR